MQTGQTGGYCKNAAGIFAEKLKIHKLAILLTSMGVFIIPAGIVSLIQKRTPNHLIGKVMAYTSAVTLCAQPIGQIVYGFLFDRFSNMIYLCLIPTGVFVCAG